MSDGAWPGRERVCLLPSSFPPALERRRRRRRREGGREGGVFDDAAVGEPD